MNHSGYYELNAEECVSKHMRRIYVLRGILFAFDILYLILLIIYLYRNAFGYESYEVAFKLFKLGFYVLIFFLLMYRLLPQMSFVSLISIMVTDCDPQKYYDVMGIMLTKYDKKHKAFGTLNLELAAAAQGLGKDELTESHLKNISFKKWVFAREIRILNIWGNLYLNTHRMDEFRGCEEHLEWIIQNKARKTREKISAENLKRLWGFKKAVRDENYESALAISTHILEQKFTGNSTRLYIDFELGRLLYKQNEPKEAYARLLRASEYGGTCFYRAEAKRLLEGMEVSEKLVLDND